MVLTEYLRTIDWEEEAYPAYEDFVILPLFVLYFPTVRFFLDRFVFEKLGRRLIFGKGLQKQDVKTYEQRKKIRKFKESAWKCIYFLSAEFLALLVTYDEPWFTNTKYFWVGPGDQVWPDQKMKLKLKGVYMYGAGFYTYSIFALIFWETRRSDFGVSMSHHVASVILIVLSYIFSTTGRTQCTRLPLYAGSGRGECRLALPPFMERLLPRHKHYRFARVGSVVLALHDANDVFLEVGKMSKYSGAERTASVAFILFVLSWIILRLVYYPFWILWSTSYEVLLTLDMDKHSIDGPIYYCVQYSPIQLACYSHILVGLDVSDAC